MTGFNPLTGDSTPPTLDGNGIAHFDLHITLAGTPTGDITLACSPSGALVLNNPYTFSSSTGTISLTSSSAITSSQMVVIKITADGSSICWAVWLCPDGSPCLSPHSVDCSTVTW